MVSIIVTCYNYGHFLGETLESIRRQVYRDWECIVVDSGSTDDTARVAARFTETDERFRYLYKADEGVSSARNAGLKIFRGDFIQFIDADDQLQKNKIASQAKAFLDFPRADIVYGDVRFYDNGFPSRLRSSLHGDKPDDWLPRISGKGRAVFRLLRSYNFLVTPSPLIRRRVIEVTGGFDERMAALEDWDFWQRCALSDFYFHFHTAQDDLPTIRVHDNSLSRNRKLMLEGNFKLLQKRIRERSTGLSDKSYFLIKYAELFWNAVFSGDPVPGRPFLLFLLSVLLFPAWATIRMIRSLNR
jgi:glycosyltransferase involved in cell wall biosynthesis